MGFNSGFKGLIAHLSLQPLNTLNHSFYFCYRRELLLQLQGIQDDKYAVQLIHLFFIQVEIQSHP